MASYEFPKGVKTRHPLDWNYANAYMGSWTAIGNHTDTFAVGLYNSGQPNNIIKVYSVSGRDQEAQATLALYMVSGINGSVQQAGVPMLSGGPSGSGQITLGTFDSWFDFPQGFGWPTSDEGSPIVFAPHPLAVITPGNSLLIVSQGTTEELVAGFCWIELPFPTDSQVVSSQG
jgi:hypothetical protein